MNNSHHVLQKQLLCTHAWKWFDIIEICNFMCCRDNVNKDVLRFKYVAFSLVIPAIFSPDHGLPGSIKQAIYCLNSY